MRAVFGIVLIIGLGLAGFAVYMVQNYMQTYEAALQQERAQRPAPVETVEVFVAAKELRYGDQLSEESVRPAIWPRESVPEGTFIDRAELFPEGADTRYVLRAMEPGEAIMGVKVTAPGEKAGLTSRLKPGMRAFAILVDVSSGVSGFLRPGDKVDVYWTGSVDGERGEVTKLIDTSIQLIAVDQTASTDRTETAIARTVTIAVNPQQVASLALAQATGRLTLALVGHDDETIAEAIEVDQRSLLGLAKKPVQIAQKPAPAPEVCTIRTRRGSEVMAIPIPCTN